MKVNGVEVTRETVQEQEGRMFSRVALLRDGVYLEDAMNDQDKQQTASSIFGNALPPVQRPGELGSSYAMRLKREKVEDDIFHGCAAGPSSEQGPWIQIKTPPENFVAFFQAALGLPAQFERDGDFRVAYAHWATDVADPSIKAITFRAAEDGRYLVIEVERR
jgi:hypothetical protein